MKKNIVLIGDIVSSKKIPNRQDIQNKIKRILMELNRENRHLLSPYTVTLGDEFQGVLSRADHLFCDIISILTYVYPIKIRFSIGIGDIQTPINPNQAIGMDGPAFHNARSGIIKLKETPWLFTIVNPHDANQKMVEQTLFLISHMFLKWKQNRFQILQRLCRDSTVKQMAQNMNITDKAIYKNIDDGGLKIIMELFSEIEGIINRSL
ncbi:MAG: hypothetical protein GTO45_22705 [Candidatus Aminicenantes bacterium]|nr:hypothetical protein [Candidatus Aminicenantes bacterium]NIM81576.1 hypothetical protein [Candidatus Aminicenantes bacterium]NIN20947.1 hypothetical protein [Candidatus Aminicenantes bacterium]NIN44768.1 hypothetical protein [Candidatus Aminicenantes bacterium]NIN87576.1 hypothetical protein [Candidatus Aminicenantes bacterium]